MISGIIGSTSPPKERVGLSRELGPYPLGIRFSYTSAHWPCLFLLLNPIVFQLCDFCWDISAPVPTLHWLIIKFSRSVLSDSLRPHGLQHARPPCLSPIPEPTQTHLHHVSDAIQPSHPLWSLSPPAFNLSQSQGLFQWMSSSHQVAKVLEFQLQHQSLQWEEMTPTNQRKRLQKKAIPPIPLTQT